MSFGFGNLHQNAWLDAFRYDPSGIHWRHDADWGNTLFLISLREKEVYAVTGAPYPGFDDVADALNSCGANIARAVLAVISWNI